MDSETTEIAKRNLKFPKYMVHATPLESFIGIKAA